MFEFAPPVLADPTYDPLNDPRMWFVLQDLQRQWDERVSQMQTSGRTAPVASAPSLDTIIPDLVASITEVITSKLRDGSIAHSTDSTTEAVPSKVGLKWSAGTSSSAKPKTKGKDIDGGLLKLLAEHGAEVIGWSVRKLATALDCCPSTVWGSNIYQTKFKSEQAELKAERIRLRSNRG